MLKAKGDADDLEVLVAESDAAKWANGTRVEMVVELVEVTINGEKVNGFLRAASVRTLADATPRKAQRADTAAEMFKDVAEGVRGSAVFRAAADGASSRHCRGCRSPLRSLVPNADRLAERASAGSAPAQRQSRCGPRYSTRWTSSSWSPSLAQASAAAWSSKSPSSTTSPMTPRNR